MGYANSAVTAMDYARAGNNAAAYTIGSAVMFGASGKIFQNASKGSSVYVDNGLQLSNTIMERIVGSGSKTIKNKNNKK